MKQILLAVILGTILYSCSPAVFSHMNGNKMDKLELGMSKQQLTAVLGRGYTIAEKRIEEGNLIEVLSYRNYPQEREIYLFVFANNSLQEWYREIVPVYEVREN
ncbi:hypothetical protein [Algoriphagus sp.]|uniref:hypothetical protein n=1 Tax=Algoriphagus sp. TaxID=1872435 RepID=UPI00391C3C97